MVGLNPCRRRRRWGKGFCESCSSGCFASGCWRTRTLARPSSCRGSDGKRGLDFLDMGGMLSVEKSYLNWKVMLVDWLRDLGIDSTLEQIVSWDLDNTVWIFKWRAACPVSNETFSCCSWATLENMKKGIWHRIREDSYIVTLKFWGVNVRYARCSCVSGRCWWLWLMLLVKVVGGDIGKVEGRWMEVEVK